MSPDQPPEIAIVREVEQLRAVVAATEAEVDRLETALGEARAAAVERFAAEYRRGFEAARERAAKEVMDEDSWPDVPHLSPDEMRVIQDNIRALTPESIPDAGEAKRKEMTCEEAGCPSCGFGPDGDAESKTAPGIPEVMSVHHGAVMVDRERYDEIHREWESACERERAAQLDLVELRADRDAWFKAHEELVSVRLADLKNVSDQHAAEVAVLLRTLGEAALPLEALRADMEQAARTGATHYRRALSSEIRVGVVTATEKIRTAVQSPADQARALLTKLKLDRQDEPACAFCSWRGTKTTTYDELWAHISNCEFHPMCKQRLEIADLRARLAKAEAELKNRESSEDGVEPIRHRDLASGFEMQRDQAQARAEAAARERDAAEAALHLLKRGECWCDVGIGNPMVSDHDEGCKRARAILGET